MVVVMLLEWALGTPHGDLGGWILAFDMDANAANR